MLSMGGVQQQGEGGFGGGGGSSGGMGVWQGGGGSGYFSPAAIYCTTTWCFALKGLRTFNKPLHQVSVGMATTLQVECSSSEWSSE